MPMLNVFRCVVCGEQTEPANGVPYGWVTLSSTDGGDVFDKWSCVEQYAAGKAAEKAAAE